MKQPESVLWLRLGRRFARQRYGWQLALAYLCVSAYVGINRSFWPLVTLVTIPVGAQLIVELRSREGTALNEHLAKSARLLLMFSALLALGIAIS